MKTYHKVIFVCMDNTCRSIMAEAVMNSVNWKKTLQVLSRGLVVLFPEPMNPKAVAILKGNQLEPSKESSEQLSVEDLEAGTLVLTMTEYECCQAKESFQGEADIYSIGEFVRKPGDINLPHGGTLAEYGACYEYIDLMVKMAAERLLKEEAI
ncbi:phosphotyrosine protein phosphatase [Hominifimenecus sp. rT4P-3]|uniref:arsenate reductase/protein-tyrosine-phosphatase family protein n=1 Tax=Hominifimenecus sp. rT4P-3 TaxID=3242979 RepID=UPI003DA202D1